MLTLVLALALVPTPWAEQTLCPTERPPMLAHCGSGKENRFVWLVVKGVVLDVTLGKDLNRCVAPYNILTDKDCLRGVVKMSLGSAVPGRCLQ